MKGITVNDAIIDDEYAPEDLDTRLTFTEAAVTAVVVGSIVYSVYSIGKLGFDLGKEGVKVGKERYRRYKANRDNPSS
jgi:hypothetical protein